MLLKYWIGKYWSFLLILIFSSLAVLSFGSPLYFDRLFIVVLIVLIGTYKVNKNLFSIGIIFLCIKGLNELAYFCRQLSDAKVIYYVVAGYVFYKFRFDGQTKKVIIPLYVSCILAESYWVYTNYTAPSLHWYIALLSINILHRMLIVSRVHLLNRVWKDSIYGINIDFSLHQVALIYGYLVVLIIFEYLVRHLTPLNPMLIYNIYPYVAGIVSVFLILIIVDYGAKLTFKFKA